MCLLRLDVFVDQARISVRGGNGGNGALSFRREKYVPRGGPDGGDGGRGGSVYLVSDPERTTLSEFRHRKHFCAENGGNGGPRNAHGKAGKDVRLPVPAGTLVYQGDSLIADLGRAAAPVCVARGGRGGLGNQHFATPTHRTPRFAQHGEPGEEKELELRLRLLADAGIVGAPNAGKSTLLAAVSAARPKIADYPFTTLEPQLGVVTVDLDAHFVLVDVPGLVAGASQGAGLGDRFLSHLERTNALIHLVDGAVLPEQGVRQLRMVEQELRAWNPRLLEVGRIIAISKSDLPASRAVTAAVRKAAGQPVMAISAVTGEGIKELVAATYQAISAARSGADRTGSEVVVRPQPPAAASVTVRKEGRAFRVAGRSIERAAAMTDPASEEGLTYLQKALIRVGARRKLERAGARAGDRIRIGDREITLR